MMSRTYIFICIICLLSFSCKDATHICPVEYQVETDSTYVFQRNWKLIGLQPAGSNAVDYPPCLDENSDKGALITIFFDSDSSGVYNPPVFITPYYFNGIGPVNYFFGSYEVDSLDNLSIPSLIGSEVLGLSHLANYENKFYTAISNANRFEIQNNILTIYYNTNDKMLFVAYN